MKLFLQVFFLILICLIFPFHQIQAADTNPPKVFLLSPDDNIEIEQESVQVSFKQIDDVSSSCSCSLYLNDEIIQTNPSVSNDTITYFTLNGIKPGTNYWTVKCTDEAGNTGSPYYVSFIASYDNLYQSDDDGQNWSEVDVLKYLDPPLMSGSNIQNIYFMDSISNGKMFISMNYGNRYDCDGTFKFVWYDHDSTFKRNSSSPVFHKITGDCLSGNPDLIRSLAEAPNGDLYAVSGGIYKSTNEGGVWVQASGPSSCYSVTVADNGYIFAASANGVYRSINNGESFELLSGSPETGVYDIMSYAIAAAGNDIYVIDGSTGNPKDIYKSIDNGETWNKVFTAPYSKYILSLFAYDQNTIFAGIKQDDEPLGAVYVSYNAGNDWQISLQQQQIKDETGGSDGWVHSIDKSPQGDIYASVWSCCSGQVSVYKSSDLGVTWEPSFFKDRDSSNRPSLVDVTENVHRSIIVSSWFDVGRNKKHAAFTSLMGGINFVEKYWSKPVNSSISLSWAGLITADIDGNGEDEIFSINEKAQAFDGQGNLLWSKLCGIGWVPQQPCVNAFGKGQIPVIGDVDGDGLMEIVFKSDKKEIICRDAATGALEWVINDLDLNLTGSTTPVIADINDDGLDEIIINGNKLYVLEGSTGNVLWSKNIYSEDTVPAAADLNQDGQLDIVVHSDNDSLLYAFDISQEDPLWTASIQSNSNLVTGYISVADVDNDNKPEVIETCWGEIFVFNGEDGSKLWSKPYSEFPEQLAVNYYGSPAIGNVRTDIDGVEMALGLAGSGISHPAQGLFLLNGEDGSIIWSDTSIGSVYGSPAIADINSDGQLEIIVQTDMVYCFNPSGEIIWSYPISGKSNVAVADVTDTDKAEIIVFSQGEIYVLGGDNVPPQLIIERDPEDVYDNQAVVFTSTAFDTSGIYYHAVQNRINGGEWATIFECYDSDADNKCDSDPFRDINPLAVTVNPYFYTAGDVVEYRSTAVDNSDPPNTGYSEEGSFTVLLGNAPPYTQSQEVDYQEYCGLGSCSGVVGFKWIYKDDDGDNEIRFDFRINNINNVDDPDPEVDRSILSLDNPDGTQNDQQVLIAKSAEEDEISYNTTYYWWVKVYDNNGADSGWISGNSFITSIHGYPEPGFTLEPETPAVDVFVQLCAMEEPGFCDSDISICYNNSNEEISCSGGEFTWDISGCNGIFVGGTDEHSKNPKVKLYASGEIKLQIVDQDGFGPCLFSEYIEPKLPYPGWGEISPYKE